MVDSRETDSVLAALARRRADVEAWMDGPVKKATLTAIDHMIAEIEDDAPSGAAEQSRTKTGSS